MFRNVINCPACRPGFRRIYPHFAFGRPAKRTLRFFATHRASLGIEYAVKEKQRDNGETIYFETGSENDIAHFVVSSSGASTPRWLYWFNDPLHILRGAPEHQEGTTNKAGEKIDTTNSCIVLRV